MVLAHVPRTRVFILVYHKVYVLTVSPIRYVYITWCVYITLNTRVTSISQLPNNLHQFVFSSFLAS